MPCKLARSAKRTFFRENKKRLGKSIPERPDYINYRKEFSHWGLNTVVGKKTKDQKVIFSVVERKTSFYIPLLIESKNSSLVNKAFKSLIENFGDKFSQVFKSVTCDNGAEFSDMYFFERKIPVYLAHPYSSYERGTNERHNALLIRALPKSESMNRVSEDDIRFYGDIINLLHRKILKYKNSRGFV